MNVEQMLSTQDGCFEVILPDGVRFMTSGHCEYLPDENTLVAPFGCVILNNTEYPINESKITIFGKVWI